MNKFRLAAMTLAAGIMLTGCSGGNESPEPQKPDSSEISEVAQDTESTAEPSEITQPAEPDSAEVSTEPQTASPAETSEPEETYIADWIFGTWSVAAVNDKEYWQWADENGIDGERQLIFDSELCRSLDGSGGIADELTYTITDEGAELFSQDGTLWGKMTYDQQADILLLSDGEIEMILRRGENPRQEQQNSGGYIADWIYGTWTAVSIDGQPFGEWAEQNGVTEQYKLKFTPRGCVASGSDEVLRYSITDEGAEVYNADGSTSVLIYDYINDTLNVTDDGVTGVFKRENGIQDEQAESEIIAE